MAEQSWQRVLESWTDVHLGATVTDLLDREPPCRKKQPYKSMKEICRLFLQGGLLSRAPRWISTILTLGVVSGQPRVRIEETHLELIPTSRQNPGEVHAISRTFLDGMLNLFRIVCHGCLVWVLHSLSGRLCGWEHDLEEEWNPRQTIMTRKEIPVEQHVLDY